jgi:hypothetical protein
LTCVEDQHHQEHVFMEVAAWRENRRVDGSKRLMAWSTNRDKRAVEKKERKREKEIDEGYRSWANVRPTSNDSQYMKNMRPPRMPSAKPLPSEMFDGHFTREPSCGRSAGGGNGAEH